MWQEWIKIYDYFENKARNKRIKNCKVTKVRQCKNCTDKLYCRKLEV